MINKHIYKYQCYTFLNEMARSREESEVNLCYKYFLFFSNFIFWLIGIAATAVGAYILHEKEKHVHSIIDFFFDPSVMLCLGGSIVVVVSFLGLVGSLREYTCVLQSYYIILMIMLMLEVVAIIIVFVFYFVPNARTMLGLYPEDTLKQAIVKYRDDTDMQNFIDAIQSQLKCCGVSNDNEGYKDWNANMYFNCTDDSTGPKSPESCSVPWSCCRESSFHLKVGNESVSLNYECAGKVVGVDSNIKTIYTKGCLKGLEVWLNENALVIGGVALGILLPQAVYIYLGKSLFWQVKAQRDKWSR